MNDEPQDGEFWWVRHKSAPAQMTTVGVVSRFGGQMTVAAIWYIPDIPAEAFDFIQKIEKPQ